MAGKRFKVTFEPEGKSVYVLDGTTIYEASGEAGIIIKAECGGIGVCGNCIVNIIRGAYEQKGSERFLTEEEIKKGAVLACRTRIKSDKFRFAIDIGTNGELVMGNRERLIACSTAAGPAFEGARITFGMRASDGAIEKVLINKNDIKINTIGNVKAAGLCGT